MKKLLLILLTITMISPLYAQEVESEEDIAEIWNEDELVAEDQEDEVQTREPFKRTRQRFEFGLAISDIRIGLDNSLLGIGEIFQEELVIDLNKIGSSIRDGGMNLNVDGSVDILHLDILNIKIQEGLWNFGFFINTDGRINLNVPKSLFTLISEGFFDQHLFEGMISASGGVYANTGVSASAKYGKLRAGVKPTLFSPLVFIPRSGISYRLDTEDAIDFSTEGEIMVYYPLDESGNFTGLNFGFDLTLDGEYALFPFLDVGGSLSRIPFAPATLRNRMKMSMSNLEFHLDGDKILQGEMPELPNFNGDDPENPLFENVFDTEPRKVFRPFRFDTYARYKPFSTEILVIRPNMGFSVDGNERKGFFNAGLEVQSTLANDIIRLYLGTGCTEAIWKNRFGFVLNLRAIELGLGGALRADSFPGTFQGKGFDIGLGVRIGW